MNLIFDLDGTLIDSRPRLYQLFQYLIPNSDLSFEEYWELKRNKINHRKILTTKFNYSDEQVGDFEAKWMSEIELKKWLALDTPFDGVGNLFAQLSKKHSVYIVTARQNTKSTLEQIEGFNWEKHITTTLVTEQKQEKLDLIKKNIQVNPEDWIIGDTGKDIDTGKKLGIKTIAVLSGFMNKECLQQYQPDTLIEDVTKIKL